MKKLFLLAATVSLFSSCDFMMKERKADDIEVKAEKRVVLGNDKDDKGCVISAGYRWSLIRKECLRVFEEGYRLNTIAELKKEDAAKSAFVIFEDDGNRAELFLPDTQKSIMLERESKKLPYKNGTYTLRLDKNYTLTKNGEAVYAGADIEENQIIGSDQPEGNVQ